MTIPTVTTETINGVADLKAGYTLGHADVAILKALAAELLAVREARSVPVTDEIYAELYRLRIENKGPDGFETWRDAAVFERTRRADAERNMSGEEMTYLEAMSLLTAEDAQNLSAIEAFRRGANYNGKINAHALRNSMRYQYLRDKDAFGAENEPGLAGWNELIELEGNEFDAAIDARMAHPDIAYTAPPAPAVLDEMTLEEAVSTVWSDVSIDIDAPGSVYLAGWMAHRAEMLQSCDAVRDLSTPVDPQIAEYEQSVLRLSGNAEPVSQGYTLPAGWIACSERMPVDNDLVLVWDGKYRYTCFRMFGFWQSRIDETTITHWMPLPAAPTPTK